MTSFDMTWDELKGGSGNVDFLTLEAGKAGNLMRVVSQPSVVDVHWEDSYEDGKKKPHKINCLGSKCILCEHGSKPTHRYQLLVLDKTSWNKEDGYGSEGPKVKILETGISVMKQIKTYAQDSDYGNPTTYDIKIKKEGSGKETRYAVVPTPNRDPFTAEEKEAIENSPSLKDLNKILSESEIIGLNLNCLSNVADDDEASFSASSNSNETDEDDDKKEDPWAEFNEN